MNSTFAVVEHTLEARLLTESVHIGSRELVPCVPSWRGVEVSRRIDDVPCWQTTDVHVIMLEKRTRCKRKEKYLSTNSDRVSTATREDVTPGSACSTSAGKHFKLAASEQGFHLDHSHVGAPPAGFTTSATL